MFQVKICGITNIEDARAAVDEGADAIGLNFFRQSRRFVELLAASKIAAALPQSVTKVGVFVNHDAHHIAVAVERVGLDAVQLHGEEPATLLAELPTNVGIIRAHRCGPAGLASLVNYLDECRRPGRLPDAVLVDADAGTDFGGTGQLADWTLIARDRSRLQPPLILAGGLTADNVAAAIIAVRPDAVDVASGVEAVPGIKDHILVARFVAEARRALDRS